MSEEKKSPTTPTKSDESPTHSITVSNTKGKDGDNKLQVNVQVDKIEARLRNGDVTSDDGVKTNGPEVTPISDEEVDQIVKRFGKMDKDELKKYMEFFWSVDTFHFGAFTVHQLAYYLRKSGYYLTNKEVVKIFSDLDKNNDCLVTLDEYLLEMSKSRPKPKSKEEMRLWFDRFDVDRDGYVSRGDIRNAMEALGTNILSPQLEDVMRNDSTGRREKLNFEDFCFAVKRMR